MLLFIAIILLVKINASWYWFVLAVLISFAQACARADYRKKLLNRLTLIAGKRNY